MEKFERPHKSTLLDRLGEVPERLILVTGPRQTGKTTLVQQVLGQISPPFKYIAADDPFSSTWTRPFAADDFQPQLTSPLTHKLDARWLVRQWEQARQAAQQTSKIFVLAIDEVQKIPNWSETVKGLWDADRREGLGMHVILLGSAPLLMQKGMSESLAGRFETIQLTHWSFEEMSTSFGFDLERYIYFGGYPGGARLTAEPERWLKYIREALVEPNIESDILAQV